MKYFATIDGHEFVIELLDEHTLRLDDKTIQVDFETIGEQPVYSLIMDGKSYEAYIHPDDGSWQVLLQGRLYPVKVEDERERRLRVAAGENASQAEEFLLKAPMPGLVISVAIEEGQVIRKGQVLVILESMKMQNELKSPRDGKVARVSIKTGDNVEARQTLLSVI